MYSIDIDIGGTFTDGFFTDGTEVRTEKVLTTPHDVTECFMNCVTAGSRAFNLELSEFLRRTSVVRVSTTVGTNLLVQRAGPKLGLLVTGGHERDLYGKGDAAILGRYVPGHMVIGLQEEVNARGRVVQEVGTDELLVAVRRLVEAGARMNVISFQNAWRNPHNERLARDLVRARYPVHYLRSVPLQLGTEVMHVADDHARTNSAALNAYIHSEMARTLYRAEDKLRAAGYQRLLLVVHASGGNARVAKTIALHTLHSGPAVAARGAAYLARLLRLSRVVTADMGGTSFDMSVIADGEAEFNLTPELDGVPIATPMTEVNSLGAGGGSIAHVSGGALRVGPDSAGSAPGPACYAKGGMEPTVTDADLLLGYIDPGYFLGGRMQLDVEAARRAMERRVARPLSISAEEAAFQVRQAINREMANGMAARLRAKGHRAEEFTLFSFGGGGPLHACAIAELTGIRRIVAFPYGSVFGAFGGSTTNVQHLYSKTLGIPASRAKEADAVLDELRTQAELDMIGEGFTPGDINVQIEVQVKVGHTSRAVTVAGKQGRIADAVSEALGTGATRAVIDTVRLTAECPVAHWEPKKQGRARSARPAPKGSRDVLWRRDKASKTPVYDRFALGKDHKVGGPAIVDGPDTSYAVAPGWTLEVDAYGNFVMTQARR